MSGCMPLPGAPWMEAPPLIELVMLVCLAASPTECREERPLTEINSVMACATQGQMVAAQWLSQHPAFTLSSWRCEVNLPRQAKI
jgi:hypothetical protein